MKSIFLKEYHKERKEHPTLPLRAITQIVRDHMKLMKKVHK